MIGLAERLRNLRNEQELSTRDLSGRIDISYSYISDIENHRKTPSVNKLTMLADYFNVSVDYLLGRTDIRYIKDYT